MDVCFCVGAIYHLSLAYLNKYILTHYGNKDLCSFVVVFLLALCPHYIGHMQWTDPNRTTRCVLYLFFVGVCVCVCAYCICFCCWMWFRYAAVPIPLRLNKNKNTKCSSNNDDDNGCGTTSLGLSFVSTRRVFVCSYKVLACSLTRSKISLRVRHLCLVFFVFYTCCT